jgi:hypothetical protein
METVGLTPEQLVEGSCFNGQIDTNVLLSLAYTVLDQNPLATPDDLDYYVVQAIGDR